MDKRATAWLLCLLSASCTTLLGIDDDYHARPAEPAGGSGGGGGIGGGVGASGGSSGRDSSVSGGSAGTCGEEQKYCRDACSTPSPDIGCSLYGCEPCPNPPEHAFAGCNGDRCDYICSEGYERQGDACAQSDGDGGGAAGQDGGGGSGGSPPGDAGTCNPVACPADGGCSSCLPCLVPPGVPVAGCCMGNGRCGGLTFNGGCEACLFGPTP